MYTSVKHVWRMCCAIAMSLPGLAAMPVHAQGTGTETNLPPMLYPSNAPGDIPLSPAGMVSDVLALRAYVQYRALPSDDHVSNDSVAASITARARAWLAAAQPSAEG